MLRQLGSIQRQQPKPLHKFVKPIRVVTVDDSALVRLTLHRYLTRYADIEIVGQATNGKEMLDVVQQTSPDVIILDVEMPVMDGLAALEILMRAQPLPVIMLSRLTWSGAEVTLRALELGAVDFVLKPQPGVTMAETAKVLVEKIRSVAYAQIPILPGQAEATRDQAENLQANGSNHESRHRVEPLRATDRIIAVASSTGGPTALTALLTALPPDLPIGGVIVQHMPTGFTAILSQRLNRIARYRVIEAVQGARLMRGQFLIAPGGYHLTFDQQGRSQLDQGPTVNGVRPAADVTLENLASLFGPRLIAVVLTGMGKDGFAGSLAVRQKGGTVLAQDAASSVVYGMPRHVVDAQLASAVAPPAELGAYIAEQVQQ